MERALVIALVAVFLAAPIVAAPVVGLAQERSEGGTLRVSIVGLRSREGNIGCALFASRDGFPGEPDRAVQKARGRFGRSAGVATCTFENVPPGRYAVSLGHDENDNGHLDRNFFGIPTEGWGVSNDARPHMAPPRWDDAVFEFSGDRKLILITVRYGAS